MKILLAVDGSSHSMDAVQALIHFKPLEELGMVHGLALPDLDHPMITPELRDQVVKEVEEKLRQGGEAVLEKAVSALPADIGPVHQIHEIGSPATVILETAQSAHPDLIILGARGLGPVQELVLGSVSHRVALHALLLPFGDENPIAKVKEDPLAD